MFWGDNTGRILPQAGGDKTQQSRLAIGDGGRHEAEKRVFGVDFNKGGENTTGGGKKHYCPRGRGGEKYENGGLRESNPRPLASLKFTTSSESDGFVTPKARIMPLDQVPSF